MNEGGDFVVVSEYLAVDPCCERRSQQPIVDSAPWGLRHSERYAMAGFEDAAAEGTG